MADEEAELRRKAKDDLRRVDKAANELGSRFTEVKEAIPKNFWRMNRDVLIAASLLSVGALMVIVGLARR